MTKYGFDTFHQEHMNQLLQCLKLLDLDLNNQTILKDKNAVKEFFKNHCKQQSALFASGRNLYVSCLIIAEIVSTTGGLSCVLVLLFVLQNR